MNRTVLILPLLLTAPFANASDISFNWLKSTSGQKSALSGNCSETSDGNLSCNLRQTFARRKVSHEEHISNLKSANNELAKSLESISPQEFVEQEFGELCVNINEMSNELDGNALLLLSRMCETPSESHISDAIEHFISIDAQTCKVYEIDTGDFSFEQVNERKWVSTNQPSGACGAVTVLSLEHEKEFSTLWTYSQVRHYTNTDTKLCQQLAEINEPISYSWKGKSPIELNCKYIEFGL